MATKKKNKGELLRAIRSFVGYLEGTEKSLHTIKNYRLDLLAFQDFLLSSRVLKATPSLHQIQPSDIERYQAYLQAQGFKTNTRRRKLLTLGRFLQFTAGRNRAFASLHRKVPAPQKVERVPFTLDRETLLQRIRGLPAATVLDARNRALLWTLAETGCQVSEAAKLRFSDFSKGRVVFSGRSVPVPPELLTEIERLRSKNADAPVFLGHNRHGALGAAISPRGIELLVRAYAARLGSPKLTPRIFRHSAVVFWLKQGRSRSEIKDLLGLKTDYAFRIYEPLLK
jgi:site-specific recombinase XerD